MYVAHETKAYGVSLLRIYNDLSSNITIPRRNARIGDMIESKDFNLTWAGFSTDAMMQFNLQEKGAEKFELF